MGDFEEFMSRLDTANLIDPLRNFHELYPEKFLLGICIGMQILGNKSEEGIGSGLGLIPGIVKKIEKQNNLKIPHMGWNSINKTNNDLSILDGIDQKNGFYFLHSYYFDCKEGDSCVANFHYGKEYPALIRKKNVFGVQGHPEKSHDNVIRFLHNFCNLRNA